MLESPSVKLCVLNEGQSDYVSIDTRHCNIDTQVRPVPIIIMLLQSKFQWLISCLNISHGLNKFSGLSREVVQPRLMKVLPSFYHTGNVWQMNRYAVVGFVQFDGFHGV